MNTRPVIDESAGPVSLSASFNNDCSCFSVGLDSGFCVFNTDPCELKVSRDLNAGIGTAEMLGRYNYLALVGGGRNPRWPQTKVIIWDDAKQKPAVTLELKTAVLRVRLTKSRIVVALQNSIHLYQFSSPPTKTSVFETADNPLGLCCLGTKIVAFPGRSPGKAQLVELDSGNVSIIPAHTSSLRAMDLSRDGTILVTASETGTLIRVFSTANCTKIAELRRGVDPAFIFSVAISPNSSLLAVTSDKSTLHIFDLPTQAATATPGTPKSQAPTGSPNLNALPQSHLRHRSQSPSTPVGNAAAAAPDADANGNQQNKWGILSRLPLLPRLFSDTYSVASAPFDLGTDFMSPSHPSSNNNNINNRNTLSYLPALGTLPARTQRGLIGWVDEDVLVVIGTGIDGRWERFRIGERNISGKDGEAVRSVWREGWKRYLN